MGFTHLLARRAGPVEYLTLNRPDVRNAFNEEMIAELSDWAAAIRGDDAVRVVVLSGAGQTFSAGADVAWMARTIRFSREENERDAIRVSQTFAALDALPVPLIARIHGAAIGGGAGLAAVSDIAVAGERTMFGFAEVRLGIIPAVISPFVVAKIGRSAARELFLTGARFHAGRAREIGLIHAVVPEADLDEAVAGYVAELLSGGREAIAAAKSLIADVWNQPIGRATTATARAIAMRRVSDEGQEGLNAFLEKRKPRWVDS